MAPGLPSLNRLYALPADVLGALRTLPQIADHTRAMVEHTAVLKEVALALREVAADTDALPALHGEMAKIREATRVLEPMDGRIETIQEAMPVRVEVQRHLAQLPETMGRLDEGIERLSALMEKILTSLDGLQGSVDTLESAVEPMSRLASRVPGQRKGQGG